MIPKLICPNTKVLDYTISISGETIHELLNSNSTSSTTVGVNFLSTEAIDGIFVDGELITEDLLVCFESFTTECGQSIVGDCKLFKNVD